MNNQISIVAEIGLNYAFGKDKEAFIDNAKRLIDIASVSKCSHVKFQKRNPDIAVPKNQKNKEKVVPWRIKPTTYLQYKVDIEFSMEEMEELFDYSREMEMIPFASVWDIPSAQDMSKITNVAKIPSAKLTERSLLVTTKNLFDYRLLSTGMSTENEIENAVSLLDPKVIFHTNSTYPTPVENMNMGYISHLIEKYPERSIGFSNHAYGIEPMIASSILGVKWIEFHITENHSNWGSDQHSSIEPVGVFKLVKGLRDIQVAFGSGNCNRILYPGEIEKRNTLRG